MNWVGAKTCFSAVLFVVAAIAAGFGGLLSADHVLPLGHWATFLASMLAVVAGTAAYRAWRVGEPSASYLAIIAGRLRWGSEEELEEICLDELVVGRGRLIELPPAVHHVVYVLVSLLVFLVPLDNRAIAQLQEPPEATTNSEFCPAEEGMEVEDEAAAPAKKKEIKMGCELVYRAYRLGYAKDLGDCADDDDDEEKEVCLKRQLDEPYLHYAWRLVKRKQEGLTDTGLFDGLGDRLEEQWDASDSLASELYASTAAAARASHHIFTNLPEPDEDVSGVGCLDRFYAMPYVARIEGEEGPSQALIHVLGQLLFNPAYPPVVGTCREFQVHWDSPRDACLRLATKGAEYLDEVGIDGDVADVLDRRRRLEEIRELPGGDTGKELPEPSHITSFQCLMVESGRSAEPVQSEFTFMGASLPVRSMIVPAVAVEPNGQMALTKAVARLVAPGFGYGRLDSEQAALVDEGDGKVETLVGDPAFMFAKLELLRDTDLFLGHHWLGERGDLLEVYPYHVHLVNFVQRFREHYQTKRGRL